MSEVFLWTHTKKKDRGQFVDERSEQRMELYKAEMNALRTSVLLGKVLKRLAPRLVDPEDASTCSGPDAREHITLMNREIHASKGGGVQAEDGSLKEV
ncbi:hypothetical protein PIB30_022951, partial [Stylosanthes scabra]|nr:hypothetical protein [Stylosanthes scabra]